MSSAEPPAGTFTSGSFPFTGLERKNRVLSSAGGAIDYVTRDSLKSSSNIIS